MSAEGQPLSGSEMMEDVMSDYANRTVTIENHPHVSGPHASIHPWYVKSNSPVWLLASWLLFCL